jgi:hypothetical protein
MFAPNVKWKKLAMLPVMLTDFKELAREFLRGIPQPVLARWSEQPEDKGPPEALVHDLAARFQHTTTFGEYRR